MGFTFLAGVLPRGQGAGARNRVVDEDYCDRLAEWVALPWHPPHLPLIAALLL